MTCLCIPQFTVTLCRMIGVVLLLGCIAAPRAKETRVMADFEPIRTVCAGRLLLDVPEDAKVTLSAEYRSAEVQRVGFVNNFEDIERDLQKRASSLEGQKIKRNRRSDALFKGAGVNPDTAYASTRLIGQKIDKESSTYVIGFHESDSNTGVIVELHRLVGGQYFRLSTKHSGAYNYAAVSDELTVTASRFVPLKLGEIPQQPGFCIDGGLFVDRGEIDNWEEFTLVVEFPKHPAVRFSIDARAIEQANREEPPLSERVDGDIAVMREHVDGVRVLDRGKKEIAGQHGYAIAIGAPSDVVPGAQLQKFFWGAEGVPRDVTRPFLEVDMMIEPTEAARSNFADDEQARAFWERLLSSLRIRPGAV